MFNMPPPFAPDMEPVDAQARIQRELLAIGAALQAHNVWARDFLTGLVNVLEADVPVADVLPAVRVARDRCTALQAQAELARAGAVH